MATELQGKDVQFLVRDYGSTSAFKEMVCEETLTIEINNDVTKTKTKCGPFVGVAEPDVKINGSAVCNIAPSGTEYSYDALQVDQKAVTKKEFVLQNRAYTASGSSVVAGHSLKISGSGYFVGSTMTAPDGDIVKFTWNFEAIGTLGITES